MNREFTFDTVIGQREAEITVTYNVSKPIPATYWQPAEGGEVEVIRIESTATRKAVFLSPDEEAKVEEEAQDRALEDWSEHINEEADYRYEQYRDRMMERGQ